MNSQRAVYVTTLPSGAHIVNIVLGEDAIDHWEETVMQDPERPFPCEKINEGQIDQYIKTAYKVLEVDMHGHRVIAINRGLPN